MLQIWRTIKGYVAGAVAFLTCPCHLVLTLPLILALTGGTVAGDWLAANTITIYAVFTIFFLGSLALAGKWLKCDNAAVIPAGDGPADAALVSSRACSSCTDAGSQTYGMTSENPADAARI